VTDGNTHYPETKFNYLEMPEGFSKMLLETLKETRGSVQKYSELHKDLYEQEEKGVFNHKERSIIHYKTPEIADDLEQAADLLEEARVYEEKISLDEGFGIPEEERTVVDKIIERDHEEAVFLRNYRDAESVYRSILGILGEELDEEISVGSFNQELGVGILEEMDRENLPYPRLKGVR